MVQKEGASEGTRERAAAGMQPTHRPTDQATKEAPTALTDCVMHHRARRYECAHARSMQRAASLERGSHTHTPITATASRWRNERNPH